MSKIHWSQWIGVIPFVFLIGIILWGYFITGFTIILNLVFVSVLLLFYIITQLFALQFFEFGEMTLKDDEELLKLEKDNASIIWAFANGLGVAFLIPGLQILAEKPLMTIIGLFMLGIGNLVYEMAYYPRYALLVRKRKIILTLNKK